MREPIENRSREASREAAIVSSQAPRHTPRGLLRSGSITTSLHLAVPTDSNIGSVDGRILSSNDASTEAIDCGNLRLNDRWPDADCLWNGIFEQTP